MGKGSSSAPSPDPNIGIAARKNADLGEQWLSFAKDQFGVQQQRQEALDDITKQVASAQLSASQQAQQWAVEDRARSTGTFQPLQDKFIKTAENWASPEKQAEAAAEARADVVGSAAAQRAAGQRSMSAMGLNPASGRFAGVERATDAGTALGAAGAQNNARSVLRNQAVALQADAVNMGNGLSVNPATSLGLGVDSGTSATRSVAAANVASAAGIDTMKSGYGAAMQGYSNQATILQNQYNGQLQAWQAQQQNNAQATGGLMSGLGSLAGMAMFSDENAKTDKEPVDGALEAVRSMPVEEWTYKPGAGDGGRHIGPYAQDFQRATGKGDGRSINVIDAIGVTMGAVQELAEKVDALGSKSGRPASGSRSINRLVA